MQICDNRVKYGYYKCLKNQRQAHLVLPYGSSAPLTGSAVSKNLFRRPKVLGDQQIAHGIMQVFHSVLDTGARIRETQQKEHIAWPSGNEKLRNELLSQPEHHQLAQDWETNISTWRRMCLQVADFPPYHRATATGEDWMKVTALPQWLAAFRADLVDYTDKERVELVNNPDVKWISYPEENDFNRFSLESPCSTTFVIDNEMESDVTHARGDEAARTELSMAEPAVPVGPMSQLSQYMSPTPGHDSLFGIERHKEDEDEDHHGELLLPYVLNNCHLYGEETGVGQAWLFVLRSLYASGNLDTEITALCEEAGLVLDMYQEAADAKRETRAGKLYDEASTIAKYIQKYRKRNLQYQLDTESSVPEPIYGPTAMCICRPRINRAMVRHARQLGVEKAYLRLPPQELYVDMLNDPNTRVLSVEETIDGHLVRPWRDIPRAPSLDESELDNENCLDAVRRPQSAEFKIRGAASSDQKIHHGDLVGESMPAVLSGMTSHAPVNNMAHTTDQQVTDGVAGRQLNTPSGFVKRWFSKTPPWRQHTMVSKSLNSTAGPFAENNVTHSIDGDEISPPDLMAMAEDELSDYKSGGEDSEEPDEAMDGPQRHFKILHQPCTPVDQDQSTGSAGCLLRRTGTQGENGIKTPRHLSNESSILVSSDSEEPQESSGTPPTEIIEDREDLGYEAGYESVTSSEGHETPPNTAPNMRTLALFGGFASGASNRSERPRARHGSTTSLSRRCQTPNSTHRFSPYARTNASNVHIFKMRSTCPKSRISMSSSEGSTDSPPHRGRRPAKGYVQLPESDGDKAPPSVSEALHSSKPTNKSSLICEEPKTPPGCIHSKPSFPGSGTSSDGMILEDHTPYSPKSTPASELSEIEESILSESGCSSEPSDEKSRSNKRKRSDEPEMEGPLHKRVAAKGPREPSVGKSPTNKRKRSDEPETGEPLRKRVAGKGPKRTPVKTVKKVASVPRRESPRLRGKARRNYCE